MAYHQLELPALHGSSPLGFLAALGTLHLTHHLLDQPPRLSWRGPDAPAVLHTHRPFTHESLAAFLATQLPPQPDKDPLAVAPGILDQPRHGEAGAPNDPLRMPVDTALAQLRVHARAERAHDDNRARWFTALINTLSVSAGKDEKDGSPSGESASAGRGTLFTRTTPYFGRTGRMTLPNSWSTAAQHCVDNPDHIHAALTRWQRVDNFTGANLDHFSTGDAHMVSHGKPTQQGVPGATWLALHGFAAFRLIGNTNRPQATSWDTTRNAFTWPIWQPPHSTAALTALLEHPIVRTRNPETAQLENLGVTALYAAGRTRLSHGDGPLEVGHQIWPRPNALGTPEPTSTSTIATKNDAR